MSDSRGGQLVAVDLGLRTGVAIYADDGTLLRYRSHNYGNRSRLRRGAESILGDIGDLRWMVVEGDAALARIWARAAQRRGAAWTSVTAEQWRATLLHPSEQRSGVKAKQHADRLARVVIACSGAAKPTSLRHDAAEAILAGLWGCLHYGLIETLPQALSLHRR